MNVTVQKHVLSFHMYGFTGIFLCGHVDYCHPDQGFNAKFFTLWAGSTILVTVFYPKLIYIAVQMQNQYFLVLIRHKVS